MEKKIQNITGRVTAEEMKLLSRAAKTERRGVSSFIIKCGLDRAREME